MKIKAKKPAPTAFLYSGPRTGEPAAKVRAEILGGRWTEDDSEESFCSSDARVNSDVRRAQFKHLSLSSKVWSKLQHKRARYKDTGGSAYRTLKASVPCLKRLDALEKLVHCTLQPCELGVPLQVPNTDTLSTNVTSKSQTRNMCEKITERFTDT